MPRMIEPLMIWVGEGDLGTVVLMLGLVMLMVAGAGLARLVAHLRRDVPAQPISRILDARTRRHRLIFLGVGIVAIGIAGAYFFVTELKPSLVRKAADAITLTRAEMWIDAINMFDEKLRIRFHYHNASNREVAAFLVRFELRDQDGREIIRQDLSITNRVPPRGNSSWTEEYWSTGPQNIALEDWEALTHKDIADYRVEWKAVNVVCTDGTILDNDSPPAWGRHWGRMAADSSGDGESREEK